MQNIPQPGEWIVGYYPTKNRVDCDSDRVPRHLCCLSIRDLRKHPLALETIERRPFTDRGRYLMFAWDEDCGETRCFYLHQLLPTLQAKAKQASLQVVGFDADNPDAGMEQHGGEFGSTAIQRAALATACRELRQMGKAHLVRVTAKGA